MTRPTLPPTAPPLLPGTDLPSSAPMPGARLTWARGRDGWFAVWAGPSLQGLCVEAIPCAAPKGKGRTEWHLGILHEASGLFVVSGRQRGASPVLNTPKDRKAIGLLLADLLALGVDWAEVTPVVSQEARAALTQCIAARLPAIPEWRAWRGVPPKRVSDPPLEHKWHRTPEAARSWAESKGGWWMVEEWKVPPGTPYARDCAPAFAEIATGNYDPKDGMTGAVWSAWGILRSSAPGVPATLVTYGTATAADVVALAWQRSEGWPTAPTGEQQPGPAAAITAGLVRLDAWQTSRGEVGVFVPTRAGLLLASREALAGRLRTPSIGARTREARDFARGARRKWRTGDYDRRDEAEVMAERFATWIELLACIARDRAAGVRFELIGRPIYSADRLTVVSLADGVACLQVDAAAGREWLTLETEPVVFWAPGSALVATRRANGCGSTVETHSARDWAENYAACLRNQRASRRD